MSWCLKCNKNVQIVVSTHTSTHETNNTTELFTKGEYEVMRHKVGEIQSEQTYTSIETKPRCSICYTVLHYPGAQTAEEIDDIYKDKFSRWKTREIARLKDNIYPLEHLPPKGETFPTGCIVLLSLLAIGGIGTYILFNTGHWVWAILTIIASVAIVNVIIDSELFDDDNYNSEKYFEAKKNLPNLPKLKAQLEKIESCKYTGYDYERNQFCHD